MNLFYDTKPAGSIDDVLSLYSEKEFRSPMRSTVPMLSWLKHESSTVCKVLQDLGISGDAGLHLEYQVKPGNGKGQASHTDLMVISDEASLAIEAKWTEPHYATVDDWLKEREDQTNRRKVLKGWLALLQKHAGRDLRRKDFSDAVYQTVHRAASACGVPGHFPKMAYLMFQPSTRLNSATPKMIAEDMELLWGLLGCPDSFPFYLIEVQLDPTPAFQKLEPLDKRNPVTAQQVQTALKGDMPLFGFRPPTVTKIRM